MTYVHIHAPHGEPFAAVYYCPTCERLRRMFCMRYEWYGDSVTCAGCGDTWHDEEREARPFAPRWRREAIEHARAGLEKLGVQA